MARPDGVIKAHLAVRWCRAARGERIELFQEFVPLFGVFTLWSELIGAVLGVEAQFAVFERSAQDRVEVDAKQ